MYLSTETSKVPRGRTEPLHNDPACHITQVACVNFIHEWRELQFNVEKDFFQSFSQSFCQKSVERKPPKKYFFLHILFLGPEYGFTSKNPTHYPLDYGNCQTVFLNAIACNMSACRK